MTRRNQLFCLWSAPVFLALFFVGFWILAGWIPPPAPHWSAAHVAAMFRNNTSQIRAGLMVTMLAAAFVLPFVALITDQMKRIEGRSSVLAYTQLVSGATTTMLILISVMVWSAAAFRPGRSPELTQALNDVAWFPFVMALSPIVIESVSIALAVLSDKSTKPVFPRWVGYFNLWAAVLYLPGMLITYFKHGAFAWNGLLTFWLALVVLGAWFVVMFVVLRRAIAEQAQAEQVASGQVPSEQAPAVGAGMAQPA